MPTGLKSTWSIEKRLKKILCVYPYIGPGKKSGFDHESDLKDWDWIEPQTFSGFNQVLKDG